MNSSESEEWIPTVHEGSSIPELINYMSHSFRDCKFNEVQKILTDREKKMKKEIENVIRERDSAKEEADLLEKTQGLAEYAKLKFEDELKKSRMQCERLKETITRLTEKQRVASDRAKKAEERCDIVSKENLKIAKEKDELISELNEEINQLRNKNLESERLVEVYQEKLKCADMRLIEAYKEAEHYKSGVQLRLTKMEAVLANYFNVKVEDLGNLVDIIDGAANGESVDLPDVSKGGKDCAANGHINGDVEDMAVVSPEVHSASCCTGSGGIGLPNKDCRNLAYSSSKEDGTNTIRTSPGTQSGQSPPHVESDAAKENEGEEPLVSGPHSDGGLPIKDKSPSTDIIVIHDSDDESNPCDTTYTTDQTYKRNREDSPVNLITKKKRSVFTSEDDLFDDKNIHILESSNDQDGVDSDDESCSDDHMENLVAILRSNCGGT